MKIRSRLLGTGYFWMMWTSILVCPISFMVELQLLFITMMNKTVINNWTVLILKYFWELVLNTHLTSWRQKCIAWHGKKRRKIDLIPSKCFHFFHIANPRKRHGLQRLLTREIIWECTFYKKRPACFELPIIAMPTWDECVHTATSNLQVDDNIDLGEWYGVETFSRIGNPWSCSLFIFQFLWPSHWFNGSWSYLHRQ